MSLKYTLAQVRDREVAAIGTQNLPNPWWPLPAGNDCLAFQLERLGVRNRADLEPHFISIAAFKAWAGWHTVTLTELQPGDLVLENWDTPAGTDAQHIEYVYSIDRAAGTIETISANTGPKAGVPVPRGAWRKTRKFDDHFLYGLRPPYADEPVTAPYGAKQPTSLPKSKVKVVAAYLNGPANMPAGSKRTQAEDDGIPGPIYWTLVQTWGAHNGLYGPGYVIDGIPGARTRQVEAILYGRAKTGHKAT